MVDSILGGLFGGQDNEEPERRRHRARDFVNRYDQGPPSEGYSDQEVLQNYRNVTSKLSPQEYQDAATEAFRRMSPEQRREFRRMMKQRSGGRIDAQGDDPQVLAQAATQAQQQEQGHGGLLSFLGFGDDKDAKPAATAAPAQQAGGDGGLFDSPVTKAVLAGVAAVALKKMMDQQK